jgi:hypothetical protein
MHRYVHRSGIGVVAWRQASGAASGGSPYTLTADAGAVPLAGADTGLAFNRKLIADTANTPKPPMVLPS